MFSTVLFAQDSTISQVSVFNRLLIRVGGCRSNQTVSMKYNAYHGGIQIAMKYRGRAPNPLEVW